MYTRTKVVVRYEIFGADVCPSADISVDLAVVHEIRPAKRGSVADGVEFSDCHGVCVFLRNIGRHSRSQCPRLMPSAVAAFVRAGPKEGASRPSRP